MFKLDFNRFYKKALKYFLQVCSRYDLKHAFMNKKF